VDWQTRLSGRLLPRLEVLYRDRAAACLDQIINVCSRYAPPVGVRGKSRQPLWDQRDVVLIAYADQVSTPGQAPLQTLRRFLHSANLPRLTRILHLLPFCPSSSDDGFSVIEYRQVDPAVGGWVDVQEIGRDFDLMFDLVLNHASAKSVWFQKYAQGVEPYSRFFVEVNPEQDLSSVVRPRTSPLLTPVATTRGRRYLWSTFSSDQLDLNYRDPLVLVEILDILLFYVMQGARIIRLDAVAYLWKESGTPCIHLPETHLIVKILRDVVDTVAPGTLLLTETNVPHSENVSYWGDGDEAHLIYNFSLPPLLLDAFRTGDATCLNRWLAQFEPSPTGTSILNFTASHDGIGVRPLESLVPADRFSALVESVEAQGGHVSKRSHPDGSSTPYELNTTYFDALADAPGANDGWQMQRFLASQALALSLRGIPAIYFHSLLGTPNDQRGVERTGRARSINRRKFSWAEVEELGGLPQASRHILAKYQRLLAIRIEQPAFHPDGIQRVLEAGNRSLVAFLRTDPLDKQQLLVVANLSEKNTEIDVRRWGLEVAGADLIAGDLVAGSTPEKWNGPGMLEPYQIVWLPVRIQDD
jgi:sucrose phosphorylase